MSNWNNISSISSAIDWAIPYINNIELGDCTCSKNTWTCTTDAKSNITFNKNISLKDVLNLQPKNVYRRGKATIVEWKDGTKTVVVKEDSCEDSMFHGFCAALAKKIFGSTTNVMKTIEEADMDERNRKTKEMDKAFAEQRKIAKRIIKKNEFEDDVKKKMYEQRVETEAMRRATSPEFKKALDKLIENFTLKNEDE